MASRRRCDAQFWHVFFATSLALLLISFSIHFSTLIRVQNITFQINNYTNFTLTKNYIHLANTSHSTHYFTGNNDLDSIHMQKSSPIYVVDKCTNRYIYVHDLPSRFNDDILKDCHKLYKDGDWCPDVVNSGLGRQITDARGLLGSQNWFATNQFWLEQIFRNRMKQYECLTQNSSMASAMFIPVYIGLDVGRYLWENDTTLIHNLTLDLVKWVSGKPEWKRMWGRDHFFVAGRISWDFRRNPDNKWGSPLMLLPEGMNMTMLSIEGSSWNNDFAIPYPTYFHPATDQEIVSWQHKLTKQRRKTLFTFVGAPRANQEGSIRGLLINHCQAKNRTCQLLNCNKVTCNDPVTVMKAFLSSVFCLQPPGDSYTRRSAFDSILAGCIPVFFHPGSAYSQYLWHLPRNYSSYSVFISGEGLREGNVSVEEALMRIPRRDVIEMRKNVIELIPRIVYVNPNSETKAVGMEDAFDVAVKGVLERVERVRREIEGGRECGAVNDNWHSKIYATEEAEKWAPFFKSS